MLPQVHKPSEKSRSNRDANAKEPKRSQKRKTRERERENRPNTQQSEVEWSAANKQITAASAQIKYRRPAKVFRTTEWGEESTGVSLENDDFLPIYVYTYGYGPGPKTTPKQAGRKAKREEKERRCESMGEMEEVELKERENRPAMVE